MVPAFFYWRGLCHLALTNNARREACYGIAPEKPVSGKIMLRVPPEVHDAVLVAAKASQKP